jgi:hypothetical protein
MWRKNTYATLAIYILQPHDVQ